MNLQIASEFILKLEENMFHERSVKQLILNKIINNYNEKTKDYLNKKK